MTVDDLYQAAVLVLGKPTGMSSFDVIRRLKPLLPGVRLGHAGTLDPAASGVLIVCTGAATRLVSHFQDMPKTYMARILFGTTTDSDDLAGRITGVRPVPDDLVSGRLPALIEGFTGPIMQTPPAYSAVKVAGVRAYALARQGAPVDIRPRQVTVHRMELLSTDGQEALFRIVCSSGTYIRSLARDMGEAAGCGACLSGLERTSIGMFDLSLALPAAGIDADACRVRAIPLADCFPEEDRIGVTNEELVRIKNGVIPHSLAARLQTRSGEGPLVLQSLVGRLVAVIRKTEADWCFVMVMPPERVAD